jgi:hypothetical protein
VTRTAIAFIGLAALACGGTDRRAADSTLARDLAMASQSAAEPQLNDTALATKAVAPARAPRRSPTRNRTPVLPAPEPAPATIATPHDPVPPTAAAPAFRGIPAGSTFALTTKGAICTTNRPGDKFTATITADVAGENGAVIPAGSTVVLEVAQVTPGDTPESATIALRIRSVVVNDQPVPIPSDVSVASPLERHTLPRDKGADRRKVVGGVVAGAIVGQILGKDTKSTITGAVVGGAAGAATAAATGTKYDACLPAGGTLSATTREPVPLTSPQ